MMPQTPIQADPVQDGLAALQAGDMDGALAGFSAARRNDPANIGLLRAVAMLYQRTERWPEAWSVAETGLGLLPDDPAFADARLAALAGCGFQHAALTLAQRQATLLPQDAQAQYRLGALLLACGDAAAALQAGRRALSLGAVHAEILLMSAEAAFQTGDLTAARGWLDQAVALESENRSIRMARATILLSLGQWMPGLEDYEYRLQPGGAERVTRNGLASLPRWTGQDLREGTLLVIAEQGVGDQMRFLRDIIAVTPFCGRLIVECAKRLTPLFRRSLPTDVIVATAQEQRIAGEHRFDYGWLAELSPDQPPVTAYPVAAYIEMGSLALRLHERGLPPDRPMDPPAR
jgi:hypothetical protein